MSHSVSKIVLFLLLMHVFSMGAESWKSYFVDTSGGKEIKEFEVLLFDSKQNRIWTEYQYINLNDETLHEFQSDGFGSPDLISIDTAGTIWQSGVWSGVKSYDGTSVVKHSWDTANAGIAQVISDDNGHYWYTLGFGTGTFRFDGTTHTKMSSFDPHIIRKDYEGNIWAADYKMVKKYSNGSWTDYAIPSLIPMEFGVGEFAIGRDGSIWIAANCYPPDRDSLGGLFHRTPEGNWTLYTKKDGLPHVDLRSVAVDSAGAVWIGSKAGLTYFDGHSFTNWDAADWGVDSSKYYDGGAVHDIEIDTQGRVWIASRGVHCLTPDFSASITSYNSVANTLKMIVSQQGKSLHFSLGQDSKKIQSLQLLTLQGRQIALTNAKELLQEGVLVLPQYISPGIYLFSVEMSDRMYTRKIVIR